MRGPDWSRTAHSLSRSFLMSGGIYSGWLGALTIRIKPTLDAMTKTDSWEAEARARASHRGAEVSADWNTATTDALLAAATLDPIIAPQSLYSAAYNST